MRKNILADTCPFMFHITLSKETSDKTDSAWSLDLNFHTRIRWLTFQPFEIKCYSSFTHDLTQREWCVLANLGPFCSGHCTHPWSRMKPSTRFPSKNVLVYGKVTGSITVRIMYHNIYRMYQIIHLWFDEEIFEYVPVSSI